MAELTFQMADGTTRSATVDDAVKALSPEQFRTFVNGLREQAAKMPPAANQAPPDRSYGSTLRAGVASAETGLRDTAQVVGNSLPDGMIGKQTLQDFGKGQHVFQTPAGYVPATTDIKDALHQGNYLDAIKAIPRAAVEALPDVAGAAATGAALTAAAPEAIAAGAGALGAGAYMGARNFGENVQAVAANNNHETPTTGDLVQGGLTTLPQAALGAVGIKPGALPVVGKALEAAPELVRGAAEVGAAGLGGAGMDAVGQVGTSVGTDKGVQFDPLQTAAAGVAGAGGRALTEVPSVVREAALRGAMKASGIGQGEMTTDRAGTTERVAADIQKTAAAIQAEKGRKPTADEVANTMKTQLAADLMTTGRNLRDQGFITPDEFHNTFEVAFQQAATHNRELLVKADPETLTTAYGRLRDNPNIPAEFKQPLLNGFNDLNTLAEAARKNRGSGPFENLLGGLGRAAGAVGTLVHNPADFVFSLGGRHSIGAAVGSRLGGMADRMVGTNQPRAILEQAQARAVLAKAGLDAGQSSMEAVPAINTRLNDPTEAARLSMGLRQSDPGAPVRVQFSGLTPRGESYGDLQPSMLTPAQVSRGTDLQEQAGNWLQRQLIRQSKAKMAAQQQAQAQLQKMDATQGQGAAQDAVALQRQVEQEQAVKQRQMDAMGRQNDAQRAQDAADQRAKEQAFQQAEATAEAQKQADEAKAFAQAQAAQAAQAKQDAADQRAGEAGLAKKLQAEAKIRAALEKVAQQDAANAERATTANEREADRVSGMAYRQARGARDMGITGAQAIGVKTPQDAFVASGGMAGSPSGPSDPLMVRADGSPVQTAQARARMNPRAQKVAEALQASPPAPEMPPAATGSSGLPEGGMAYVRMAVQSQLGSNTRVDPAEVIKAVGDLVQADLIPTDIGQAFIEKPHVRITSELGKVIAAQVIRNRGEESALVHTQGTVQANRPLDQQAPVTPAFPAGDVNGGANPIRNLTQWTSVRDANRAFAEQQAAQHDQSWPALATAVRQIAVTPKADQKKAIAQAFLRGLSRKHGTDEDRYKTAAQVLSGPLLKGTEG